MRQPGQFDPPEITRQLQCREIMQIIHLEDFQGFKFGEMSDQAEVDRLAEAEKQRLQAFEWLKTGQVRQRYAGNSEVTQSAKQSQRLEIPGVVLDMQGLQNATGGHRFQ